MKEDISESATLRVEKVREGNGFIPIDRKGSMLWDNNGSSPHNTDHN